MPGYFRNSGPIVLRGPGVKNWVSEFTSRCAWDGKPPDAVPRRILQPVESHAVSATERQRQAVVRTSARISSTPLPRLVQFPVKFPLRDQRRSRMPARHSSGSYLARPLAFSDYGGLWKWRYGESDAARDSY